MFSRKLIYVILIAVIFVSAGMFVGCEKSSVNDSTDSEVVRSPLVDGEGGLVATTGGQGEISSLATFSFDEWRVEIVNTRLSLGERSLTLFMNVSQFDLPPVSRNFAIQFYSGADGYIGYTSSLFDPDGALLWEFDFAVDTHNYENFRFAERTDRDSMIIEHLTSDSSYVESYTINEETKSFYFPTLDVSRVAKLRETVFSETVIGESKRLSLTDQEIVTQLESFRNFYLKDNSLHNNSDGVLVAELLASDKLSDWLAEGLRREQSGNPSLYRTKRYSKLCTAAGICTALKCPELVNPACEVCGAIVLACAVMDLFDLW